MVTDVAGYRLRHLRHLSAAASAVFAGLVLAVPPALAAGSPDQVNLPTSCCDIPIHSDQPVAQSFTVGMTGEITAVKVELHVFTPSVPLEVEITRLSGGIPDLSQVIGSGFLASTAFTNNHVQQATVDLTVRPVVMPGQQYAIVLTTSSTSYDYGWRTDIQDGYAGGTGYVKQFGTWYDLSFDHVFETFVGPVAVTVATTSVRGAYCTVAGNTTDDGSPLVPGTFVNLDEGQALTDPHYLGASAANFIQGVGLTCAPPPAGYARHGYATRIWTWTTGCTRTTRARATAPEVAGDVKAATAPEG